MQRLFNAAALEGGYYNTAALEGGAYNTAALVGGSDLYDDAAVIGGFALASLASEDSPPTASEFSDFGFRNSDLQFGFTIWPQRYAIFPKCKLRKGKKDAI